MNGLFVNGSIIEKGLQAFSWMLIHSLWQGLLLAFITGIIMTFTKKARSVTRYALITGCLFTFLAICCGTFIYEWDRGSAATNALSMTATISGISVLRDYAIRHWPAALAQYCSEHAIVIVATWFAFFSFKCWQMNRAFQYVRRVRTTQRQQPGLFWQDKMTALTQQLQINRTVTLLESGITKIPVVIGHIKPIIYMPIGLLANLPAEQVEAVLLHELAHIRRNDYLLNFLQNIAETIFFFNPGLLWVSSLLKQEREHCCDDVALAHTGNKRQFIQALISFKEHMLYGPGSTYAITFPGKKSHLLQRVTRIIQNRNNPLSGGEKIFVLGSLLICFILLGTMANKNQGTHDIILPVNAMYADILQEHRSADALMTAKGKKAPVQKKPEPVTRHTPTPVPAKPSVEKLAIPVPPIDETIASIKPVTTQVGPEKRTSLPTAQRPLADHELAQNDYLQAARDREQAERDRAQADIDRKQAERDRANAEQHRRQADRDRLQAFKDREQAARDRAQADKDREQAAVHRAQADRDRANAELSRRQADKDREQTERIRAQHQENQKATVVL
jgi:bla regulator protein BlaR1